MVIQRATTRDQQLQQINQRPETIAVDTTAAPWTDEHRAQEMQKLHLYKNLAMASRTGEFIVQTK